MSDPKYKDIGLPEDRLIDECGELIQAICKAKRFGWTNFHPGTQVQNINHIISEMDDVSAAILSMRDRITGILSGLGR